MLALHTKAPDFTLTDTFGENITLSHQHGHYVILYFYPADDTPGCTLEAQQFSARKVQFEAANALVFGISTDTETSHRRFCQKYNLTVTLLSDLDHKVTDCYGAWGQKKLGGYTSLGTIRSTYLIDTRGYISEVWPIVNPAGHADEVLHCLQEVSN